MSKMTFVVEFEDGKEPPIQFTDNFLGIGGRLCSASFFDYKEDLLSEAEVEAVQGITVEHEDDWLTWCQDLDVDPDEIDRKLNLMG